MATTLNANAAALKKGSVLAFPLGFAVEEFKEKRKKWRNLEIRLAKDCEIANIKNRVRPNVLRP